MDVYQACENRNLAVTLASRHCAKFSDTLEVPSEINRCAQRLLPRAPSGPWDVGSSP